AAGFGRFTRGRGVEGDLLLRALPILVHVPPVDLCGEGVTLLRCGDHGDLRAGSNVAVHVVRDAVDVGERDLGADALALDALRLLHGHVSQVGDFGEGEHLDDHGRLLGGEGTVIGDEVELRLAHEGLIRGEGPRVTGTGDRSVLR